MKLVSLSCLGEMAPLMFIIEIALLIEIQKIKNAFHKNSSNNLFTVINDGSSMRSEPGFRISSVNNV